MTDLPIDPTGDNHEGVITLPLVEGLAARQVLLALEGDAFGAEVHDNGNVSEYWEAGIVIDRDHENGCVHFTADGATAITLLEAATRFQVDPYTRKRPTQGYRGRYLYFATGYGLPEVQKLIGPVNDRQIQALEKAHVRNDLGLMLAPSTTYTGGVTRTGQRPRVLAVLEDLTIPEHGIKPATFEALLADVSEPRLVAAADYVVDHLVATGASIGVIDHAVARQQIVHLRQRVAQGLSAYLAS